MEGDDFPPGTVSGTLDATENPDDYLSRANTDDDHEQDLKDWELVDKWVEENKEHFTHQEFGDINDFTKNKLEEEIEEEIRKEEEAEKMKQKQTEKVSMNIHEQ